MDNREVRINLSAKGKAIPVSLQLDPQQQRTLGELTDASRHGMFIKTDAAFQRGQELEFDLTADDANAPPIRGRLAVCWLRPRSQGVFFPKGIGTRVVAFYDESGPNWHKIIETSIGHIDLKDLFAPQLVRLKANTPLGEALATMTNLRQKVAVVTGPRGQVLGTLDLEDAAKVITTPDALSLRVGNVYNPQPLKVPLSASVDEVFRTLKNQHKDSILVMAGTKLVGLITLDSILPYWYEASVLKEDRLRANLHRTIDIVAHDMRNPTGVILSAIQCLRSGVLSSEDFFAEDMPAIIERNCHTMMTLIDDLLGSYLRDGGMDLNRQPTDLTTLTSQCLLQYTKAAAKKGITLSIPEGLPPCIANVDEQRMERVLANLVSNAIKYSSAGDQVTANVTALADAKVQIAISDSGQGIAPEEQARVFDFYCKISSQPTAGESSTGLGMAISKQIITAHGGTLQLTSELGAGSTFTIILPQDR